MTDNNPAMPEEEAARVKREGTDESTDEDLAKMLRDLDEEMENAQEKKKKKKKKEMEDKTDDENVVSDTKREDSMSATDGDGDGDIPVMKSESNDKPLDDRVAPSHSSSTPFDDNPPQSLQDSQQPSPAEPDEFATLMQDIEPLDSAKHADLIVDIDTRLPYRHGWPLLPVLPVTTTHDNIPKLLGAASPHVNALRELLRPFLGSPPVTVAHRFNAGTAPNKATLTLCVQADMPTAANSKSTAAADKSTTAADAPPNANWLAAIRAFRTYTHTHNLTLSIEILDPRAWSPGLYTLPILATETELVKTIKKKQHGIVKLLNECGAPWTSLDFSYRGLGRKRAECKPTVRVGTPVSNRAVWWERVVKELEGKCEGKFEVEIAFAQMVKYAAV